MPVKKRNFKRQRPELSKHKLFVLALEGRKTEQQYFDLFKKEGAQVRVRCLPSASNSSPNKVLRRMQMHLRDEPLEASDQAWLVVDRDEWKDEQLLPLHAWTKQRPQNHFLALSNPKFEYWLLLHFEKGDGIVTARDCDVHLKKHLPDYDKSIPAAEFTHERIGHAIQRARALDTPPCTDWPRTPGSTVYRLVQHILESQQK